MGKIIKLTESEFKNLITESVKNVIREYDEYNEFDRNGDVNDMSPWYRDYEALRLKLHKEPYSKENERLLMNYLKDNGEDVYGLYDELGDKYPRFKKAFENLESWENDPGRVYLPNKDDAFPTYGDNPDRQNKPYAKTALDWSAVRGYDPGHDGYDYSNYGDKLTAYTQKDKDNRNKNPKNDINLNVYNRTSGKYGMLALSDDPLDKAIGRSARNTMRDTYNAAKRRDW